MKYKLLISTLLTGVSIVKANNIEVKAPIYLKSDYSSTQLGDSYSDEAAKIAPYHCFVPSSEDDISYGATTASLKLDKAYSYQELIKELGIDVSLGGGYDIFSASVAAKYAQSLKNEAASLSFGYVENIYRPVAVNNYMLSSLGKSEALNFPGKFLERCGNKVYNDYKQGSKLVIGLTMNFASLAQKQEFSESVTAGFGSFANITEEIKTAIENKKINANISISAMQVGGDASKLSKILNKDDENNYYAIKCSTNDLDACDKAVNGILDYIHTDYQDSISEALNQSAAERKNNPQVQMMIGDQNNTISYDSILAQDKDIDLDKIIPDPNIAEIKAARKELVDRYKKNEYYKDSISTILTSEGYPVTLDDNFKYELENIKKRAQKNIEYIKGDSSINAIACYTNIDSCIDVRNQIIPNLDEIQNNEMTQLFKNLEYFYKGFDELPVSAAIYNDGGNNARLVWKATDSDSSKNPQFPITSFSLDMINADSINMRLTAISPITTFLWSCNNGNVNEQGDIIFENKCEVSRADDQTPHQTSLTLTKYHSSYYIKPYDI